MGKLLLIDTGNIHLAVGHVAHDLSEEVSEVHRDHHEHQEVVQEPDEAEQSLGQEVERREEVGDPDEPEDGDTELEGEVEALARPEVAPQVSEEDGQVAEMLYQRPRLPGEPPVVLLDLSEYFISFLHLRQLGCVSLILTARKRYKSRIIVN